MKIKPYVENFLAPEYKGNGLDIYLQEDVTLNPSEPTKIKLGFATEIPSGHIAMLVPRSSAGAIHGIHLRNTVGVIDEDYRGEWIAWTTIDGNEPKTFHRGERLFQALLVPVAKSRVTIVKQLSETERGEGGFGSTGK